ncbi:hypothetical protein [Flagellimonas pacifica]|uniref:Uncharacterized protein n=1 Tax=Flagellimonas pacifica TaxID=1247520 RepID=A0A285MWE5_9FLAO|nr:hypothetical protein [Allomuricauda parva]SNZ00847.1 hypothetical protein SAMN06265377_2674 [Allomuricauda parva]
MEKLEKHIKEKLGERKITPSSEAWDKIASQVTVEGKPKQKRWFPYAIAASFIGILVISIVVFTSKSPEEDTIQLVEENKSNETEIQRKEKTLEVQPIKQEKSEVVENQIEEEVFQKEARHVKVLEDTLQSSELAERTEKQPLNDVFLEKSDQLITQKVNEIAEQVALLESTNTEVTDVEVDSLLRAAQKEILTEQLFASNGTVDAMALLAQAEDELDESFRNQIFDALKDGYSKLRTAVAERNN